MNAKKKWRVTAQRRVDVEILVEAYTQDGALAVAMNTAPINWHHAQHAVIAGPFDAEQVEP